jgi:hypothetical protein
LNQITRSMISLCRNSSGAVMSLIGLISHVDLLESVMRTQWNQIWIATVIPAVLFGSAAFGQTKRGWVDPPADLVALPARASELSSAVQIKPAQAESSSALVTAAPASETPPASSLSEVRSKPVSRTERDSAGHLGQQGPAALFQPVPRQQNPERASEPVVTPTSGSSVAGRPGFVRAQPTTRQQEAQSFAIDYLNVWSASNRQALQATPEFYGSRVLFHGQRNSFGALLAKKRRFAQRWPDRNYRYRPNTMNVRCTPDGDTCTVRSAFDFEAANLKLNRRSRGVAAHELVVSFAGQQPMIISENSRVLSRSGRQ